VSNERYLFSFVLVIFLMQWEKFTSWICGPGTFQNSDTLVGLGLWFKSPIIVLMELPHPTIGVAFQTLVTFKSYFPATK
jgi:hypothetical protein